MTLQEKVVQVLVKQGCNEDSARRVVKRELDFVQRAYPDAKNPKQIAEIMRG